MNKWKAKRADEESNKIHMANFTDTCQNQKTNKVVKSGGLVDVVEAESSRGAIKKMMAASILKGQDTGSPLCKWTCRFR